MYEKDIVNALLRINLAEVEKIEYHRDNRTDVKLLLTDSDARMVILEVVSLSTGSLKYKTGWKETIDEKRNSANTVGNDSSTANLLRIASMRDATASSNSIPQNTENATAKKQYSIREEYAGEIEAWARAGKPDGEVFVLGSTGDVLQGLGAIESDIYMMGDKVKAILKKHPEMTLDEIKKIPQILEKPVLILASRSLDKEGQEKRNKLDNTRVVIFGNVKAKNGKPIMSVLDLRPVEKKLVVDDMQKVSSAYTKETNPKAFIEKSQIMYADKKITTSLLRSMGFRAPIELNDSGYIGSISYTKRNVKLEGKNFDDVVSEGVISNKQYSDRISSEDELALYDLEGKWNDYIGVQKEVVGVLKAEGFFDNNEVTNQESGMVVRISTKGIKETLGTGNRFQKLAKKMKVCKVATLRALPRLIETGHIIADDVDNVHDETGYKFAYIGNEIVIDDELVEVRIAVKKKIGSNHFWIHHVDEYKKSPELLDPSRKMELKETQSFSERSFELLNLPTRAILETQSFSADKIAQKDNKVKLYFSDREDFDIFMDVFVRPDASKERTDIVRGDVARLKERLSIHKAKVDDNSLRMIAEHFLRTTDSTYDVEGLKRDLSEVYSYIAESDSVEWEAVLAQCYDVARKVIEKQKKVDIKNNYFKAMLDEVRSVRISLSAEQIEAAVKEYGERYRNKFFGKIVLANDGVSLESQWFKWSEKYPEIFDKDIAPGEQVTSLLDMYEILRESAAVYETYTEADMIRTLGTEIYHQYWIRSDYGSVSEAKRQRIKELNFEHRKSMEKLRKNYNADTKEQTYIDIIKKLQRQVKEEREEGRLKVAKYRDRVKKNNLIKRITKDALTLNQWIVKNSKEKHVADIMKGPVAHLINAIDFSSKQLLGMNGNIKDYTETKRDISLSAALEKVRKMIKDGTNAEISEEDITELHASLVGLPAGFIERVEELSSKANDVVRKLGDNSYVLNKMDYAELETLEELVTVLKKTVQETNELYASSVSGGVPALAQDSMQHMDDMGKKKAQTDIMKGMHKLTEWSNALPLYVFKRFGEGGIKIYEGLQNGWDKFSFLIRDIIEFKETVYTDDEVEAWSREIIDFEIDKPKIKVESGNIEVKEEKQTIRLSVAQIMSLYCLSKREQGRQHILKGGIRAGDLRIKGKTLEQAKGIILSEGKLEEITGSLTDRQREVADKLQSYLVNECATLGNEVTMRRFGIKAFTEENYFPIKTDASLTNGDAARDSQPSLFRLLNMSFTKLPNPKAGNKIVVENIFDVFAGHTSDMAKYNAIALPVLDACKWFMYKESGEKREGGANEERSVRKSMDVAFGSEAANYVSTFLKDINGQINGGRDNVTVGFFRRAKLASVGINLRVVALQPTSYLRAGAVIDPGYLAKGVLRKPQGDMARKWCGIALWKSLGFYDINVGRGVAELIKNDERAMDKVTKATLKGAEVADSVTWGCLWNACEAEIKDKRKDLKPGSDEFNKAVGRRLRDVIYATQVVDSTMTRSHIMRGKGGWEQMTTAFASEPTLSYNMLMDVCYDWSMTKRQKGSAAAYKKHGKRLARVFMTYTVTNMITALVESGFDAWRDDEDMEPEEFVEVFFENFARNMDVLGKIPYWKEIIGALQGFTQSRLETQWMQYTVYALNGMVKLLNGEGGNAYTTLRNAIRALSSASGLPVYNLWRELESVFNRTGILEVEELKELLDETLGEILPSFKSK